MPCRTIVPEQTAYSGVLPGAEMSTPWSGDQRAGRRGGALGQREGEAGAGHGRRAARRSPARVATAADGPDGLARALRPALPGRPGAGTAGAGGGSPRPGRWPARRPWRRGSAPRRPAGATGWLGSRQAVALGEHLCGERLLADLELASRVASAATARRAARTWPTMSTSCLRTRCMNESARAGPGSRWR